MPKPRKLALNFRGTLPGGTSDQYQLGAELTWMDQRLSTNVITVPNWQNSTQVGISGAGSSMGVFVSSKQLAPQGTIRQVLDKRKLRVVFRAEVLKGNLSAQAIEQAAWNNLTLELIDLGTISGRMQPGAATAQRIASSRQLAHKRPVQTKDRNARTRELKLPSWSNYVSPKKPGE